VNLEVYRECVRAMLAGKTSRVLVTISISCCFIFIATGICLAKSFKIYGSVSDEREMALSGVEVVLQDKGFSGVTDETGQYVIVFDVGNFPEKCVISFSLKGCKTSYRAFTLKSVSSSVIPLNIVLKEVDVAPVPSREIVKPSETLTREEPAELIESSTTVTSSQIPSQLVIRTKRELRYIMGVPTYVDVPLTREEILEEDARLRAIYEAQNPEPKQVEVVTGPPVKFTISGNVINDRRKPVSGADVFLGKNQEAYAKTDRRGKFTLEFLVPSCRVEMGRTLIIQHKNFDTRNVPVRFNPKDNEGVEINNIQLQRYRGLINR
jgi:hypothetical protein